MGESARPAAEGERQGHPLEKDGRCVWFLAPDFLAVLRHKNTLALNNNLSNVFFHIKSSVN